MTVQEIFDLKLQKFISAGHDLVEAWQDLQDEDGEVKNYPKYLPSFDEFIADMDNVEVAPSATYEEAKLKPFNEKEFKEAEEKGEVVHLE